MKFSLSLSRAHSLQPLFVMIVIILLPMFLSSQVGYTSIITRAFPSLSASTVPYMHAVISLLLISIGILVWRFGPRKAVLNVIIFYAILSTIALGASTLFLVLNLQSFGPSQAVLLFKDAAIVWWMTVLTFSLWYWLIDSGWAEDMGMHDIARADFSFPQQVNKLDGWKNWKPKYVDYMFLAFNTNTAFSPTDAVPLSHRAKLLMVTQSSLALVIVGAVVSRAVNILAS